MGSESEDVSPTPQQNQPQTDAVSDRAPNAADPGSPQAGDNPAMLPTPPQPKSPS